MPRVPADTRFRALFAGLIRDGGPFLLVLSDPASATVPERSEARRVRIRTGPALSVSTRHGSRVETANLPLDGAEEWLAEKLRSAYRSARLLTPEAQWQLVLPRSGQARLARHAPAPFDGGEAHDRRPASWLDDSAHAWLTGLGVTDADGCVRRRMEGKLRQVERYMEILSHLFRECGWRKGAATAPVIADMGCGRGYLTFAAWHLLRRRLEVPARVIGVESRAELAAAAEVLARETGAEGLSFQAGAIAETELPDVDGWIALHACDTATDDAILRGVKAGARLIVVAPCCQKQLRPLLQDPEALAPVLHHGVMRGRMADWLTDGLRALYVAWAGYRVKVIEFVPAEHTPKNLLIAAVREGPAFADPARRERIERLKEFFGVSSFALDPLLRDEYVAAVRSARPEPPRRRGRDLRRETPA